MLTLVFHSIKLTRVNRTMHVIRLAPSLLSAYHYRLLFARFLNCSMFASKRSQELEIVNDETRSSFNCIRVQLYE
ncbi:Hypothetical protein VS_II1136 [Vibrio atlanticus]|uniref:Uncharacterized protein n=1 Tax=Vibrio atlanticus (strain LGP32) TaxID=575788 RepID=B7VSB6_VIBA3|nr:Hypothetical protein VS_II1136 [Vibrio atlanticus]